MGAPLRRLNDAGPNQRTGGFSDAKAFTDCVWNSRNTDVDAGGHTSKCSGKQLVLYEAWNNALHLRHPEAMPGFPKWKRWILLPPASGSLVAWLRSPKIVAPRSRRPDSFILKRKGPGLFQGP